MSEIDAADGSGDGPDDDVTPREGAIHVAFVSVQTQLVILTAMMVDCGSVKGLAYFLWLLVIVPQDGVPFEAAVVGIPSLIALLILRRARRTGRRRIWWRVQMTLLGLLAALMLVGKIIALTGNASERCDYE